MVAQITPLPTPPTRQDPANFSARGDAFLGALPQFQAEANALASEVSTKNTETSANADTALSSANSASASAAIAAIKAQEAQDSAALAEQLVESYQGSLPSDPVVDKNGQPLTAGDWYINSVSGFIRAYTGSIWVQGVSAVSGVSSINGLTGDVTGIATLSGDETFTNKTFTGYTETVYQLLTNDVTPSNGTIQYTTLTADTTFTDGLLEGQSVILMANPSTFTITWPTVVWIGDLSSTAPLLVTGVYNCLTFFKLNGLLYGKYEGRA